MPEKTGFWAQFFRRKKARPPNILSRRPVCGVGFRQNAFLQKIAVRALAIAEKMIYNYVVKLCRGGAKP